MTTKELDRQSKHDKKLEDKRKRDELKAFNRYKRATSKCQCCVHFMNNNDECKDTNLIEKCDVYNQYCFTEHSYNASYLCYIITDSRRCKYYKKK